MYGDDQPAHTLYSKLKAAVQRGDPVFHLSTTDTKLRDYLPIETVVSLLADVALHSPDAGVINICAGVPTTLRQLVTGWLGEKQWAIDVCFNDTPYPDNGPMAFWGDRTKLNALLAAHHGSLATDPDHPQLP
jgi:nucleoside-diphosphate-sugar epimerase